MKCPSCGFRNVAPSSFCPRCGISLSSRRKTKTEKIPKILIDASELKLSAGDFFGDRYEILKEIDRGGMGRVYKAKDKDLGIVVALKIIHTHNLTDRYALERFKKEILLAREISHENVIRIHDFGEEQGIKFISMQFVEGENLKDLIQKKGMLGMKRAIDISRQICNGLQVAHKKGVVHRDLKPHNIMIDRKGNAYIMDFGLAKSIEGEGISLPDMVVGTPEYISPEQAKGEKVDARSDIYSLGIIMYEMITGKLPFTSETVLGYLTQHINKKPVSPSISNPLIPSFFSKIILRCLEKNPAKRYPGTQEILRDFAAEEVASGPFFRRPMIRRIVTVSAIILLLLIVAFGVSWIKEKEKKAALLYTSHVRKSVAVMYFENHTGDRELDNWSIALTDLMITDLAQSRYFRVLPENHLFQILKDLGQKMDQPLLPEMYQKIASRGGVDYVISGSFTRAGDVFRIAIKILNPRNGEFVDSGYVDGQGVVSFFSLVDQLTTKIKTRFNITQPDLMADIDREITKITTSSPEAFRYYIEGKHNVNLTHYREGIRAFEEAIDIDPDFAMAYWALGYAYAYLGDWEKRKIYFNKTMELRDHMSERERYIVEGTFYGESELTFKKSIQAFEKLLEFYPDDCDGNEQIGINYQFVECWDQAIQKLETNRRNQCLSLHGCILLSHSYLATGDWENALKVLEEGEKKFSETALIREFRGKVFLVQNRYDLALLEYEKALNLEPHDYRHKIKLGDVYFLKNDFNHAENIYRENLSSDNINRKLEILCRIQNLYFLQGRYQEFTRLQREYLKLISWNAEYYHYIIQTYVYLEMNRLQEAADYVEKLVKILKSRNELQHTYYRMALYIKTLIQLEFEQTENAHQTVKQLKKEIEKCCHPKQIKFYYHVMGVEALKQGRYDQAIESLQKAISHQSDQSSMHFGRDMHAIFFDDLALAYMKKGELDKAVQYYEKITTLTTGRFFFSDIYARSFYHLAGIYQQMGWKSKALDYYGQFLKIREKADRNLPELIDAITQHAILKNRSF